MPAFLQEWWNQILATSITEHLAVFSGLLYVLLIANGKRIGWFFALISTGLYIYLCFFQNLYIESVLQVFYFIMAIYGWLKWKKDLGEKTSKQVIRWPIKWHLINILLSITVAIILGFLVGQYTDQEQPYLDAFTTIFSLAATFMVAKKVLENWLYWIFIDIALAVLYTTRNLSLTGVQYAVFAIIAIFAYWKWLRFYNQQSTAQDD